MCICFRERLQFLFFFLHNYTNEKISRIILTSMRVKATRRRMKFHQRFLFVWDTKDARYKTKSTRKKHIERDKDNSDEKTQKKKNVYTMGSL